MKFVSGYFLLQAILLIVILLLGYFIYDKRFHRNHGEEVPDGFERTDEVNIDPVTGDVTRVYFHPRTGERFYKKEK